MDISFGTLGRSRLPASSIFTASQLDSRPPPPRHLEGMLGASLDLLLSSAPGVAGGLAGAGGDGASAINSAPTVAGAVAVAGDGDSDGDSDVLFIAEV